MKKPLSLCDGTFKAMEYLQEFLIVSLQLENLKEEWIHLRLNIHSVDNKTVYESFKHVYKTEILEPVKNQLMESMNLLEDKEFEGILEVVTEYEMKLRQIYRLLENIECLMIRETLRKVSKESTLVIHERNREETNMAIDLWKTSSMKENLTIAQPHLVEEFVASLHVSDMGKSVGIDKDHFELCLSNLASACMIREKQIFLNYATFYENLLRQQNNLLFIKEREEKGLQEIIEAMKSKTSIGIDCGLAEKCYTLLVELTALRSKAADQSNHIENLENHLDQLLRQKYNDLVKDLFNSAFGMKSKLEQFCFSLYDDVYQSLTDVSLVLSVSNF